MHIFIDRNGLKLNILTTLNTAHASEIIQFPFDPQKYVSIDFFIYYVQRWRVFRFRIFRALFSILAIDVFVLFGKLLFNVFECFRIFQLKVENKNVHHEYGFVICTRESVDRSKINTVIFYRLISHLYVLIVHRTLEKYIFLFETRLNK